jgi:hypothetical protein
MVSDLLRLLELVTTFIAHPDAGAPPDFLDSTVREPPGIFRPLSRLVGSVDQLKLQ